MIWTLGDCALRHRDRRVSRHRGIAAYVATGGGAGVRSAHRAAARGRALLLQGPHGRPLLGRFMQADSVGYGDGMNIYAWVRNNPVNGTSPWELNDEADAQEVVATLEPRKRRFKEGARAVTPTTAVAHTQSPLRCGGLSIPSRHMLRSQAAGRKRRFICIDSGVTWWHFGVTLLAGRVLWQAGCIPCRSAR